MVPDARAWRRWTWLLIAWSAAMVALALVVTVTLGDVCDDLEGAGFAVCTAGTAAGTIIAWVVIGFLWLVGFLLVALGWFARRPPLRLCPPYGHVVPPDATTCPRCEWDFVAGRLPGRDVAHPGTLAAVTAPPTGRQPGAG